MFCCQLANRSTLAQSTSVVAEKCFVVWNGTVYDEDSSALNNTVSSWRQECPNGWDYERDPIETSIVTDVSIIIMI